MTENTPTPAELARDARLELEGWEEAQGDYDARGWGKLGQLLTGLVDTLEALTAEHDALAAKLELAPHDSECASLYVDTTEMCMRREPCDCWKSTAPATVLAQVKAAAWDEGKHAMTEWKQGAATPQNPYRIEREAQ